MTINDEILAIANQLANKGTKPTVALIKTRLTQSVPLPKIISVLKSWQHDPEFTQVSPPTTNDIISEKIESKSLHSAIEKAIIPLRQEIADLKAQVQQLIAMKR